MNPKLSLFALPALLVTGVGNALAQALPTSQPALIQIFREQVKLGRAAEHARIEAGWPAAFAKAKSPNHYLAMTSLTGASEAWFIVPYASNAVAADEMKLEESDTTLAAELQRLSRADAEVLNDSRSIQAVARTDLSHGAFPNLAKQRYWEITIFRVRPGHVTDFEAAAKAYGTATDRTAPGFSYTTVNPVVHHGGVCEGGALCTGNRDLLDDFGIEASPTTGLASIIYTDDQYQNDANHQPYTVNGCTAADNDTATCRHTNVATQTFGNGIYAIPKKK